MRVSASPGGGYAAPPPAGFCDAVALEFKGSQGLGETTPDQLPKVRPLGSAPRNPGRRPDTLPRLAQKPFSSWYLNMIPPEF